MDVKTAFLNDELEKHQNLLNVPRALFFNQSDQFIYVFPLLFF